MIAFPEGLLRGGRKSRQASFFASKYSHGSTQNHGTKKESGEPCRCRCQQRGGEAGTTTQRASGCTKKGGSTRPAVGMSSFALGHRAAAREVAQLGAPPVIPRGRAASPSVRLESWADGTSSGGTRDQTEALFRRSAVASGKTRLRWPRSWPLHHSLPARCRCKFRPLCYGGVVRLRRLGNALRRGVAQTGRAHGSGP